MVILNNHVSASKLHILYIRPQYRKLLPEWIIHESNLTNNVKFPNPFMGRQCTDLPKLNVSGL